MTVRPLPPGTDRQLWTMTLGALLAGRGEDDALSPLVVDELHRSEAGSDPILYAFSNALASLLNQQHEDPIGVIRAHLAELAVQGGTEIV